MDEIKGVVRYINTQVSDNKYIGFIPISAVADQQTIISNMALMYARAHKRVAILDLDFSSSAYEDVFRLGSNPGLSDYLNGNITSCDSIIQKTEANNVSLISSGTLPVSETEYLLGDPKLSILIKNVKSNFDVVLYSFPKYTSKSAVKYLYREMDGIVLVIKNSKISKVEMLKMIGYLKNSQVKILGYVGSK